MDILGCEITLCRSYLGIYSQVGYAERKLNVLQALLLSMYFRYFSFTRQTPVGCRFFGYLKNLCLFLRSSVFCVFVLQPCDVKIRVITDFQPRFFMSRLFCQPSGSDLLFHVWRHKDTAFTVLRFRPAMDSYAASSRHLFQEWQESLELR